jgi:trimeric autotransporter adhesin
VLGQTSSSASDSAGVKGIGGTCGFCIGVYGSVPGNGIAVRGETPPATNAWGVEGIGGGSGIGVYGHTPTGSAASYGVEGYSTSTGANAAGVYGLIVSNAANAAGVDGYNGSGSCCGMGVAGFHARQGIGVYGESPNGFAVSGFSPNNGSGYFQGSVKVVGMLTKSGGAFQIDHPLDPAHKYLQHSFVESPDMMNVYNGNVRTDAKGFATVRLPNWFQVLNKDFRYQLTIVGTRGWRARVVKEIRNNRFTIQSDLPRVKVSWQVTGIRHDAWANAHRIQVVVPKEGKADGRYVHPELYGKPLTKSVVVLPGMDPRTRPEFEGPPAAKKR